MSGCAVAGAGQRISSASRTASAMSFVTSDELRLMPPAKILHDDRAAGRVVRRDRRGIAPPQPHVVAGERHVARRRERAVAAAEDRDAHQRIPFPQHEMLHLAHRVARQRIDEHVFARHLEARELRQQMRLERARVARRARPPHHIGDRHLLPFRIGAADHGAFGDVRMRDQHALDLGRIDVLAAGNDHVLLAVVDEEMPVGVARADVAGMIPAVAQRLGGRRRVAPVFEEHVRPAHHDFARDAGRDLVAVVVDHARLADEAGQAGRAGALVAADARIDRDRAGLGRAVDLQHRNAARREGIDQALRHLRRAGGERAQAGDVGRGPARMLDHRLHGGGHQHGERRLVAAPAHPAPRRARSARCSVTVAPSCSAGVVWMFSPPT